MNARMPRMRMQKLVDRQVRKKGRVLSDQRDRIARGSSR